MTGITTAAWALAALTLLAGCGGDDQATEPSLVSLSVSRNGGEYELTAPATVGAGLVEISLQVDSPRPRSTKFNSSGSRAITLWPRRWK